MNTVVPLFHTPASFGNFDPHRRQCITETLRDLTTDALVKGVLWGGSTSYMRDVEKADVDLFCLVSDTISFEKRISNSWLGQNHVDAVINQGYFPWTGKLFTVYYVNDREFSVDLCLVDEEYATEFFWEPDGLIVFDPEHLIGRAREAQLESKSFTRFPFLKSNPFSLSLVTVKKIEKNLYRGHLWNAIELLNILRRYLMQIIRLDVLNDRNFLGRVDREIERVLPDKIASRLSNTTALYDKYDIASKSIDIIDWIIALNCHFNETQEHADRAWVLKELGGEREKLKTYRDAPTRIC